MKKFMLAASAFAILAVSPAMAQNAEVQTQTEVEAKTGWENTKEATADAWESTKKAVSEAADATAAKTEEIYEDTAAWLDSKTDVDAYVDNQTRFSVTDLSGMDVYNSQNVKIGEVSDLIIEDDGDIEKLVITSGGLLGLGGETVAIDYDDFKMRTQGDAGYSTNLTEAELKAMTNFDEATIEADKFLATDLIGKRIINNNMAEIATVDNIIIEGDDASKLLVSYNTATSADSKGLVDFDNADIVMSADNKVQFKLDND